MQHLSHFDDTICHIQIEDFYSSINSQKKNRIIFILIIDFNCEPSSGILKFYHLPFIAEEILK